MIRVEHLQLPAGLSAVARSEGRGNLVIFVSDGLEPSRQRAAVRVALRAARRHDWQFGLVPVPAIVAVSAVRHGVLRLGQLMRLHLLATTIAAGSVATLVAAGVIVIAVVPYPHGRAGATKSGAPSYQQSPARTSGQTPGARQSGSPRPSHSAGLIAIGSPGAGPRPSPTAAPTASLPTPPTGTASPQPSSTASSPSAKASPSPSPSSSGDGCIHILGVVLCL